MNYPFFSLQSPVSTFQLDIDKFIQLTLSKTYSGITTKRLFGVPVSQVYTLKNTTNQTLAGRDFGKIAVLVVDMIDYTPLCAVLIESASETKVTEGVERILNESKLPWIKVNPKNMENCVLDLLRMMMDESSPTNAKKPVQPAEWQISRYFRKIFNVLPKEYRVMEQIALSEVIETLNFDNRNQKKPSNWSNPTNLSEFAALSETSQYYKLNDFASRTSLDLLIVNNNPFTKNDEWWPILAIEIDGNQHKTDERQKFNDSLKDRICYEALLPILRIKLYESQHNLYDLAEKEIENMSSNLRDSSIVFELINHLVSEGMASGSLSEQSRKQDARRKEINKYRRIKVLMQQGLGVEDSLEVFQSENSDQRLTDWIDEMSDMQVAEEMKKDEMKILESQYRAMFGKNPEPNISVSHDGVLTGSLGDFYLPKVKCICSFFGQQKMEGNLQEFGAKWLIQQSLYSERSI